MRQQRDLALNGVCPYFTMFPLQFPMGILQHAATDQWVMDPFCGRGTTLFAGRVLGLASVGIDSNPVAVALSEAKLANTSPAAITHAADEILSEVRQPRDSPSGEFWELAYHEQVLRTMCSLREGLLADCSTDARKALRAILLGALHGPQGKSKASYFSNQCPRTYAPKPRYAITYWRKRGLLPTAVNVREIISDRAQRYFGAGPTRAVGKVVLGDSRQPGFYSQFPCDGRIAWIITSPPYYGMRTYRPDQWLRLWFLGGPSTVDYSAYRQIEHSAPERFCAQLAAVWRNAHSAAAPEARLIIRFGSINDRKVDALSLLRTSLRETGWQVNRLYSAGSAERGRRQASHFASSKRPALEEFDVWATREA